MGVYAQSAGSLAFCLRCLLLVLPRAGKGLTGAFA